MYGSDQSASLEEQGLRNLVNSVRKVDTIIGASDKTFLPQEIPSKKTKVLGKQKINILMKYFAVIPARGGSKTIKNKNRIKINGIPLINYSLMHASFCKKISKIFVTSDNNKILNLCNNYNCELIKRPKNISSDSATLEEVLGHTISIMKKRKLFADNIVLLQPTSPIRFSGDISKAMKLL